MYYFLNQLKNRLLMKGIQPNAIKGTKIKLITKVLAGAGKLAINGRRKMESNVIIG
jgi:hypothetical protein